MEDLPCPQVLRLQTYLTALSQSGSTNELIKTVRGPQGNGLHLIFSITPSVIEHMADAQYIVIDWFN